MIIDSSVNSKGYPTNGIGPDRVGGALSDAARCYGPPLVGVTVRVRLSNCSIGKRVYGPDVAGLVANERFVQAFPSLAPRSSPRQQPRPNMRKIQNEKEQSFFMADLGEVYQQHRRCEKSLGKVKPFHGMYPILGLCRGLILSSE